MTKRCVKCEKVKPIEEFNLRHNTKDGHTAQCTECINLRAALMGTHAQRAKKNRPSF